LGAYVREKCSSRFSAFAACATSVSVWRTGSGRRLWQALSLIAAPQKFNPQNPHLYRSPSFVFSVISHVTPFFFLPASYMLLPLLLVPVCYCTFACRKETEGVGGEREGANGGGAAKNCEPSWATQTHFNEYFMG